MPPPEQMYCAQQIKVPCELPDILKNFTKSAIRTQPPDLLAWSAAYFTALANGQTLPVKKRLEPPSERNGVTAGLLEMMLRQVDEEEGGGGGGCSQSGGEVETKTVLKMWGDIGLPRCELEEILEKGAISGQVKISKMKFAAMCASHMAHGNLVETMKIICQVLTEDADGGASRIPYETFVDIFMYLVNTRNEDSIQHVEAVLNYLREEASRENGMVMPRNFMHPDCPKFN